MVNISDKSAQALQLTAGAGSAPRRALDFYPTPPEVTRALLDFLTLPPSIEVLEPACGTGEMVSVIAEYGHPVIASDVAHTGFGVGGIDFLLSEVPHNVGAIITNPPFNLSEAFIEFAIPKVPIVAFLLKSQYWHAKRRSALFRKYPPAYVLPLSWRPDFLNGERGGSPTMEVAWSVWIAGNTDTRYRVLDKPSVIPHSDLC